MKSINIKRFYFTGSEVLSIRKMTSIVAIYKQEEETELGIWFFKDKIEILRDDDESGNDFDPIYEFVNGFEMSNYLSENSEALRLYCQMHYLMALSKATFADDCGSIYMRMSCLDSDPDKFEFDINMNRLLEFKDYLCPNLFAL